MCVLQGCGWFFHKPSSVKEEPPHFLQSVKLVDAEPLQKGGKIQIIPFTAGIEVEAGQDLDRLALAIIQGVTEVVNAENKRENLNVVFGEEADQADFQITGHIIRFSRISLLKKIFFKKKMDVTIEGKMVSQKTGETLFIFSHHKELQGKDLNPKNLGRILGNDLGRYIVSIL